MTSYFKKLHLEEKQSQKLRESALVLCYCLPFATSDQEKKKNLLKEFLSNRKLKEFKKKKKKALIGGNRFTIINQEGRQADKVTGY